MMDMLLSGMVSSSLQRWLRDSLLGVYDEYSNLSHLNQDQSDMQEEAEGAKTRIIEVGVYIHFYK
jgi:hypothetical protein